MVLERCTNAVATPFGVTGALHSDTPIWISGFKTKIDIDTSVLLRLREHFRYVESGLIKYSSKNRGCKCVKRAVPILTTETSFEQLS